MSVVFIGDGGSDIGLVRYLLRNNIRPCRLFAKSQLADFCKEHDVHYIPFDNFRRHHNIANRGLYTRRIGLIILGIKYPGHESAAAVVIDGEVVAGAQERFDRIRHSRAFPGDAISWCLKYANLFIDDLDAVAVQYDFSEAYRRYLPRLLARYGPSVAKAVLQNLGMTFANMYRPTMA